MPRYERVLAAVEAREAQLKAADGSSLWKIADALLSDIPIKKGSDVARDAHDGSRVKLVEVAAKIKERHPDASGYDVSTLADLRFTSHTFKKRDRKDGVSLWIHREAGSPEFLDYLFKEYGSGKRGGLGVDVLQIRALVKKQKELLADKRRKATEDAERRLKSAKTDKEKEQAKKDIDDNIEPPKGSPVQVPDKHERHELHLLADLLRIETDVTKANKLLRENLTEMRSMEINPDFIESLADEYEKLGEVVQQSIDFLTKTQKTRFKVHEGGRAS